MILCEEACAEFITSNEEMRARLMAVAAKRVERMAVWVTSAERDGFVHVHVHVRFALCHSLARSLARSLTHSLTRSLTESLTRG